MAYGGQAHVPYPSFADVLWVAWYPLVGLGIYYLIRVRVPQFELHRWMDGIAVTLLVLAAGFALVIQPATAHKTVGSLAAVVAFGYPVLDVLLIGAILGVYGLLGWRPDTMWLLIGLAIVSTSVADAVFAVQEAEARAVVSANSYNFIWTAGALLLALAAWAGRPRPTPTPRSSPGCAPWRWRCSPRPWPSAFSSTRLPRGRQQRADRDHRGAGGGVGADHPDPAPEEGGEGTPACPWRPGRTRRRTLGPVSGTGRTFGGASVVP